MGLSSRDSLMNHQKERMQMTGGRKAPGALSASEEGHVVDVPSRDGYGWPQARIAKVEEEHRFGRVM